MKHNKLLIEGKEAVIPIHPINPFKSGDRSPSPSSSSDLYDRHTIHPIHPLYYLRLYCRLARLLHRSLADIDWDASEMRFTDRQRLLRALTPLESDIDLLRLVAEAPPLKTTLGAPSRKEARDSRRRPHGRTLHQSLL